MILNPPNSFQLQLEFPASSSAPRSSTSFSVNAVAMNDGMGEEGRSLGALMMKQSASGISSFFEMDLTSDGVNEPWTKMRSTVIAGKASSRTGAQKGQFAISDNREIERRRRRERRRAERDDALFEFASSSEGILLISS